MRLKLFRAPSVTTAMTLVRTELGPDALILATRRIGDEFEITAALEPRSELATEPGADVAWGTPFAWAADPAQAEALRWHGVPAALVAGLAAGSLTERLSGALRFGAIDFSPGAAPLLLVGPPGSGKTLTTARLATRLVLGGQVPLVISADGERAGAAEQLAAFTRLLGIPLIVASDAATLGRALTRRQDGAPVLIDTAGIDPFDPAGHAGLGKLAATAGGRAALVLPAGLDAGESADIATVFAAAGATMLIATRLDVARRLGGVLAAAAVGLTLTEAGTGPGAADGLQPMTPALLDDRLATPNRRAA